MKSLRNLYRIGFGPSSSHTMGPQKAAQYMLDNYPDANSYEVILYGSLALTGKGHLTEGIIAQTLGEERTKISLDIKSRIPHPNTLDIKAYKDNKLLKEIRFISIGGGAIKVLGNKEEKEQEVYPFKSFKEIISYSKENNISLADIVYKFEDTNIKDYLNEVYDVMVDAINRGLTKEGVLPGPLKVERKAHYLHEDTKNEIGVMHVKTVSKYAYAVSEENASGGLIVTAPTCGACGVLPAVLYYLQTNYSIPREKIIDGLAVASLIGNIIKQNASISGAFAGCQAEIGSACSMAAAAMTYINGYSLEAVEYSAEIAMEHHLGLTCDPVNGLVQIPCIERNAAAALRALDASSLSSVLTGHSKISFDQIVATMFQTGKDLKKAYKETSQGGLAKEYGC